VIFAARVLNDVIDRAVQAHGALGIVEQTPLAAGTPTPFCRLYDGLDKGTGWW
jgi:alkylation response protein AidB-like acyl-CoA dehydrogenase